MGHQRFAGLRVHSSHPEPSRGAVSRSVRADRSTVSADKRASIRFELVTEADVPLLRGWLCEPHVRQWWGDPETELALIREARRNGSADGYIVHIDGGPATYIQCWRDSVDNPVPWQMEMPEDAVGIDLFIGRPDMIGRGLGPEILRAFVAKLISEGVDRFVIDPDDDNIRAIRAYEKVGFTPFSTYRWPEGGVSLLMALSAQDFQDLETAQ